MNLKAVLVYWRRRNEDDARVLCSDTVMAKNCHQILLVVVQWNVLPGGSTCETGVISPQKDCLALP